MNDKTYRIYDSTVNIRSEVPRSQTDFMVHDKDLVNSMKRTMKKAGYSFRQDVTVAKCIRRGYFAGSKDDVHFHAEAACSGLMIEFYEDVIRDNKCGGRYHFDKMAKMPYLRRRSREIGLGRSSSGAGRASSAFRVRVCMIGRGRTITTRTRMASGSRMGRSGTIETTADT
jgi:hypothetical protein